MTDEEYLQVLKGKSSEFSDEQLLELATIADAAYKRNFCQLYEPQDFAEEFIDNFVTNLEKLPPEISQVLKDKILQL